MMPDKLDFRLIGITVQIDGEVQMAYSTSKIEALPLDWFILAVSPETLKVLQEQARKE